MRRGRSAVIRAQPDQLRVRVPLVAGVVEKAAGRRARAATRGIIRQIESGGDNGAAGVGDIVAGESTLSTVLPSSTVPCLFKTPPPGFATSEQLYKVSVAVPPLPLFTMTAGSLLPEPTLFSLNVEFTRFATAVPFTPLFKTPCAPAVFATFVCNVQPVIVSLAFPLLPLFTMVPARPALLFAIVQLRSVRLALPPRPSL
jgi:hypothetical protein